MAGTQTAYFDLYGSQLVEQEASAGDADMAKKRLELLAPLALLDVTPAAIALAPHVER